MSVTPLRREKPVDHPVSDHINDRWVSLSPLARQQVAELVDSAQRLRMLERNPTPTTVEQAKATLRHIHELSGCLERSL